MLDRTISPRIADAPEIVVVGTSMGGLGALQRLLSRLPAEFPTPVVVVQHMSPGYDSHLDRILARHSVIPVSMVYRNRILTPGVHVAPSDHHLVVGPRGRLELSAAPPIHFSRPAVDPLFESAARWFGHRVIGVILTGRGADGSAGARAIRKAGGTIIVQDGDTAVAVGMPQAAIANGSAHVVLSIDAMASALVAFTMMPHTHSLLGLPRLGGGTLGVA